MHTWWENDLLSSPPFLNSIIMKKILLHDQQYTIGGPKAVLDGIEKSYLGEKYHFVRIPQKTACGFNLIKAWKEIKQCKNLIDQEHADSIYICGFEYPGFLMTIASKLSNVKRIVLSCHGSAWDTPDGTFRKFVLKYIIETIQVYLADSIITVCEAAQCSVGAIRIACHGNNSGVIYNTFPNKNYEEYDTSGLRKELGISKDKIVVTSVGRVVEPKGHAYTIQAIKELNDPRYVFVVVGDGPYLDEYRKQCKQEIDEGRVILLGQRSDVFRILRNSDIYLFSTLNENHSIALLEAVNMKCCALCTNVGGNPEIIEDGVSGVVVPKKDPQAIVEGLKLLEDSELRAKYANKAYEICKEKFSIENTYCKLERVLVGK